MNSKYRTQVYWRNGRLWPVRVNRPTGRGRWPQTPIHKTDELVAIIEGDTGEINIKQGKSATPERVNDALLFHRGIDPSNVSAKVWSSVPETLLDSIAMKIKKAETALSDKWKRFSNEEAMTGAFFSSLDGTYDEDGWQFQFSFVEFSKQVKEPNTGTDVAVILDVLAADKSRSFKTIWLQAKSSQNKPTQKTAFPRMKEQLSIAQSYCSASFGIVYSAEEVTVIRDKGVSPQPFHQVISEAMQCRVGDTSVTTLKNSLNRQKLFQVVISNGALSSKNHNRGKRKKAI